MPYNETTAQRIRELLLGKGIDFMEKKMFGGVCFMVDDKMCFGLRTENDTQEDRLMCRVGEAVYENCLEENYCIPMEFTGRPMKGFVYVLQDGFKSQPDLEHWVQLCLDYNPLAKKSKKKK